MNVTSATLVTPWTTTISSSPPPSVSCRFPATTLLAITPHAHVDDVSFGLAVTVDSRRRRARNYLCDGFANTFIHLVPLIKRVEDGLVCAVRHCR
jgi:hypothetical protein